MTDRTRTGNWMLRDSKLTIIHCINGSKCSHSCKWLIDKSTILHNFASLSSNSMAIQLTFVSSRMRKSSSILALIDLNCFWKTLHRNISARACSRVRWQAWQCVKIVGTSSAPISHSTLFSYKLKIRKLSNRHSKAWSLAKISTTIIAEHVKRRWQLKRNSAWETCQTL